MYLYYQQQVQASYIPKKGFASKGYQFDIEWDAQSELFFALKKYANKKGMSNTVCGEPSKIQVFYFEGRRTFCGRGSILSPL